MNVARTTGTLLDSFVNSYHYTRFHWRASSSRRNNRQNGRYECRPYVFGTLIIALLLLLTACTNAGITATPDTTPTSKNTTTLTTSVTAIGNFSEYPLPQTGSGLMRPAIDHQGRLWFGEMGRNYLAMFDPHTQKCVQVTPPHGAFGIMGIAVADDDTIWFAEQYANYIGHYNPTSKQFTVYSLPSFKIPDPANSKNTLTLPSAPNELVIDARGNIWFTELNADAIGMLDSHSDTIKQYPLGVGRSLQKLNPYGITLDKQGNIWFTEASGNQLGRLNTLTGHIDSVPTPDPTNPLMEITADTEGHIWATSFNDGQLVMFTPANKTFTLYHAPSTTGNAGGLYGLTITAQNEVWLTVSTENVIARFDVSRHRFVYYPIPSANSLPLGIVAGIHNNSFWFTEAGTDKIGMLQVPAS